MKISLALTVRSTAVKQPPKTRYGLHGDKTSLLKWHLGVLHILYRSARIIPLVRHTLHAISSIAGMEVHDHALNVATDRWMALRNCCWALVDATTLTSYTPCATKTWQRARSALYAGRETLCVCGLPEHLIHERSQDLGDTRLAHHQVV